jgi:hypothetical protein
MNGVYSAVKVVLKITGRLCQIYRHIEVNYILLGICRNLCNKVLAQLGQKF